MLKLRVQIARCRLQAPSQLLHSLRCTRATPLYWPGRKGTEQERSHMLQGKSLPRPGAQHPPGFCLGKLNLVVNGRTNSARTTSATAAQNSEGGYRLGRGGDSTSASQRSGFTLQPTNLPIDPPSAGAPNTVAARVLLRNSLPRYSIRVAGVSFEGRQSAVATVDQGNCSNGQTLLPLG